MTVNGRVLLKLVNFFFTDTIGKITGIHGVSFQFLSQRMKNGCEVIYEMFHISNMFQTFHILLHSHSSRAH